MKRLFLALVLLAGFMPLVKSQSTIIPDLAKVVRTTPESAQFEKYGDYPVDYSTGIPAINIPIYTINTGRLTLPINISYHASGFKPADQNGTIGRGWVLNAGGRISRTVCGKSDEMTPSPYPLKTASQLNMSVQADRDYVFAIGQPYETTTKDTEYDIFYYDMNKTSGKFVLKNTGANQRTPVTLPFRPIKITSNSNLSFNSIISYFQIVDEDGTIYRFGKSLADATESIEVTTPDVHNAGTKYNSSWLLREMISADKSDTIFFKYIGQTHDQKTRTDMFNGLDGGSLMTSGTCAIDQYDCNASTYPISPTIFNTATNNQCIVSEITFRHGKLLFDYVDAFQNDKKLNRIRLLNSSGQLVKNYLFTQSYFGPNPANGSSFYKLDGLAFQDGGSTTVSNYSFNYTNSTATVEQNMFDNKALDFWGYYNGYTTNTTLLPNWTVLINSVNVSIGSANRQSNETAMKTYILNKITYPTGGTTDFVFEANKIAGTDPIVGGPYYVGGLRIKQMVNTAGSGAVQYRTFTYGDLAGSEDGYTNLQLVPNSAYFYQTAYNLNTCQPCPSNVHPPANQSVRKTYSSNFVDGSGLFENYPVFYSSVTEYLGDQTVNSGKTTYDFVPPVNTYTNDVLFHHLQCANIWHGGEMSSKKTYKNISGTYTMVEKEEYTYFQRQTESLPGLKVISNVTSGNDDLYGVNLFGFAQPFGHQLDAYKYYDYSITSGINYLQQKTNTKYTDAGAIAKTENYTYNSNHNYPIAITGTNSKGQVVEVDNKYPTDLTLTAIPEDARQKLVTNNILSPVLQTKTLVNAVQQTLLNTYYKDFGNGIPVKESVDLQVKANTNETRTQFVTYDAIGNLLSQRKINDIASSYIWDYKNSFPVAEVQNALSSDIAYASFEAEGKGNWLYTGTVILDYTSPTGKRCYILGSSITKSLLSTTTTYIVSYWKKSGTVAVNGTTAVAGRSFNGWTYYEHKVVNPAGGLITVSGSSGIIDELRLYPANAKMQTYAFDPLIGMTSQCDINNRIAYFEYDALQRLILVRDQDKNILKEVCYNYSGQPESCSIVYNVQQTGTFTGVCTGCMIGAGVIYTVPANVYHASTLTDANLLAQNDVAANGQAYANSMVVCTTPGNPAIDGSNSTPVGFTVQFHNNNASCSPVNYNFTVNTGASHINLGTVKQGNYNVTFSAGTNPAGYTYRVNGVTLHAVGGTISNMNINPSATNAIVISP